MGRRKVLEVDSGDVCTPMCLVPLYCTLKRGKEGKFCDMCIFPQFLKMYCEKTKWMELQNRGTRGPAHRSGPHRTHCLRPEGLSQGSMLSPGSGRGPGGRLSRRAAATASLC